MQSLCSKNNLIKSIFLLTFLVSLNLVSAIPQVIFSYENITIWSNETANSTIGNYQIYGEGLNAVTTFPVTGNCNFSYTANGIPLIFSREFQQNETDLSILIHTASIFNNLSEAWQQCTLNLSVCMNDVGYKGNYTDCNIQLGMAHANENKYSSDVTACNAQAGKYKSWMYIGGAIGIIGLLAAWNFRKKAMVRTIKSPLGSLPGSVKL